MTLSGSGIDSIIELRDAGEFGLLLAIGFCILFVILDILLGHDFIDDA